MEGFGVTIAFWILAITILASGAGVFVVRDLLRAVLSLIVSFIGIAGMFVLLSADFLGMAQIVIYVGAISVIILFAIFLTPHAIRVNTETVIALPAIAISFAFAVFSVFVVTDTEWNTVPETSGAANSVPGSVNALGTALLETWVLPFQIASVLLTAALIGAIMIVRSRAEEEEDLAP